MSYYFTDNVLLFSYYYRETDNVLFARVGLDIEGDTTKIQEVLSNYFEATNTKVLKIEKVCGSSAFL